MRRLAPFLLLALAAGCGGSSAIARNLPLDKQLDLAIERYYAKDAAEAAPVLLDVYQKLADGDLKKDTAEYYLAGALADLGYVQAAVQLYFDVVASRRAPDLVAQSLDTVAELARRGLVDERRLIDDVLFGNQYGDLPTDTSDFVRFYQALGELRRGFGEWGVRWLDELGQSRRFFGYRARFTLAVHQLSQGNGPGAEVVLRALLEDKNTPNEVRNDVRLALAREHYGKKEYKEAFALYAAIDTPLTARDVVLLEKAWTELLSHDEQAALGLLVGLGAPVYKRLFAPERALIRAMAFVNLCQYRAAHLDVLDFRRRYGDSLRRIKERERLEDDPVLARTVLRRDDLVPSRRYRDRLRDEKARLDDAMSDGALRQYVSAIYEAKLTRAEAEVARQLEGALGRQAEELLRIEEQMNILDYELGLGLFRTVAEARGVNDVEAEAANLVRVPGKAAFKFEGEYWSDELSDYVIVVEDRCVR
jgi:hypothetical protein